MRIELVGGMGIGKTTLCRVLEEIGYHCIYEDLGQNPFLEGMYDDPESFRFPSQMWFILAKYGELQSQLKQEAVNVIDQAMLNNRAYSNLLYKDADPEEFSIIQDTFTHVGKKFGEPDLLVYLKASPEIQMKRIHTRRRGFELDVDLGYLIALRDEIERLLRIEKERGRRIIEIDTDKIFLPDYHIFARQLGEDIAKRLNFCINPPKENLHTEQFSLSQAAE